MIDFSGRGDRAYVQDLPVFTKLPARLWEGSRGSGAVALNYPDPHKSLLETF